MWALLSSWLEYLLFFQHATCSTSTQWRWSPWQALRLLPRPYPRHWQLLLHLLPPLCTSRCLHKASRLQTTKGSESGQPTWAIQLTPLHNICVFYCRLSSSNICEIIGLEGSSDYLLCLFALFHYGLYFTEHMFWTFFFTDVIFIFQFFMVHCSYRLFFRRHYPSNTVTFCDTDPQDRKWVQRHADHYVTFILSAVGTVFCYLKLKIYWQDHSSWAFHCLLPHLQVEQTWGRHSKVSKFLQNLILPLI